MRGLTVIGLVLGGTATAIATSADYEVRASRNAPMHPVGQMLAKGAKISLPEGASIRFIDRAKRSSGVLRECGGRYEGPIERCRPSPYEIRAASKAPAHPMGQRLAKGAKISLPEGGSIRFTDRTKGGSTVVRECVGKYDGPIEDCHPPRYEIQASSKAPTHPVGQRLTKGAMISLPEAGSIRFVDRTKGGSTVVRECAGKYDGPIEDCQPPPYEIQASNKAPTHPVGQRLTKGAMISLPEAGSIRFIDRTKGGSDETRECGGRYEGPIEGCQASSYEIQASGNAPAHPVGQTLTRGASVSLPEGSSIRFIDRTKGGSVVTRECAGKYSGPIEECRPSSQRVPPTSVGGTRGAQ